MCTHGLAKLWGPVAPVVQTPQQPGPARLDFVLSPGWDLLVEGSARRRLARLHTSGLGIRDRCRGQAHGPERLGSA